MGERLADVLGRRVLIADGGMGTMLQGFALNLDDFLGLEGCNEILNVTRPDVVAKIHREYYLAGADLVETNTFGANLTALGEYGISERLAELAFAGAQIARQVADEAAGRWVLGSIGPGTKLPTLGHVSFVDLRAAYQTQALALIDGGVDAFQIETCQDLLQAKAAIIGVRRALADRGKHLPILVNVTVETTGTMLVGSEIGAALTSLAPLGIDVLGLNCATGPAEMTEHLRYLSRHAGLHLGVMPNAGLPELGPNGAHYPLGPEDFAQAVAGFATDYGLAVVGGCCGTTPDHIKALRAALGSATVTPRHPEILPAVSSLYAEIPLGQDLSYLAIGERTNANGSKAFREAMIAEDWAECVAIAKDQSRAGAHLLDLCVDYVGRDGAADLGEIAARLATAVSLPIMLDSTEPAVLEAGLEKLAGRCIINSVNFEDGDGPSSRFARTMRLVCEHGAAVVALTIDEAGQARTAEWKVRVASRLIEELTSKWGLKPSDIIVDCLTFPITTGQEETRRDAIETIAAIREIRRRYPEVWTTLGVSNVSFGLNLAARAVLNSVFLHECLEAGLTSAIVHAEKIQPMAQIPEEQRQVALDLIYDRRRPEYDPLVRFLELFEGVTLKSSKAERAAALLALPINERLAQRIVDGNNQGLTADLDEALATKPALDVINEDLLSGMKTVGELFGSGQMQLPFVLAAAEVMKQAVTYLEPHLDKTATQGKGTLVLATVKGDVHDIGKNLVDIIVSNNGYSVVNLGIKQSMSAIIAAAEEHQADAIGMSGLLVKSTQVMRDNLVELGERGLDHYPVLLGGAALTRAFVEEELNSQYRGEVRYAKDAFEGLSLMESVMAVKRGEAGAELPQPRGRRVAPVSSPQIAAGPTAKSSAVARLAEVPTPPFWGSRVVRGLKLTDVAAWLDHRALFRGQWGLKGVRGGESYEELVAREGQPRLNSWLDRIQTEQLAEFGVVYGYWPCFAEGDQVVLLQPGTETVAARFVFPRQSRGRGLCLADFFRTQAEGGDVIALQLVTMGGRISERTAELFAANEYRDYLELHGLSVQLTEALAEMWHARVREELGFPDDPKISTEARIHKQEYRSCRYSFGYPACPDLADRRAIVELLDASRIGVLLSEELQLHPEQATDAFVVHHPEASYFNAR